MSDAKRILPPHLREGVPELVQAPTDVFADLGPGSSIELASSQELSRFEEAVASWMAHQTQKSFDHTDWLYSASLASLVRPRESNSSLLNLKLNGMLDPFKHLLDVNDRNWRIRGRSVRYTIPSKPDLQAEREKHSLGFTLEAETVKGFKTTKGLTLLEIYFVAYITPTKLQIKRVVAEPKNLESALRDRNTAQQLGRVASETSEEPAGD